MAGNKERGTISGFGVRKFFNAQGLPFVSRAINLVVPKGETSTQIAERQKAERNRLAELRGKKRTDEQTYGQYYDLTFTGTVAPRKIGNIYEDVILREIDELSQLPGAMPRRSAGGRKATRRRRHRVRQTRRK
jgi:hypothetical protein